MIYPTRVLSQPCKEIVIYLVSIEDLERDGGGRFLGRQTVGRGEQRALSLNIWESENSIGNSNKNLQVLTGGLCYLVV